MYNVERALVIQLTIVHLFEQWSTFLNENLYMEGSCGCER